LHCL